MITYFRNLLLAIRHVAEVNSTLKADVAAIRRAVEELARSNRYLAAAERHDREQSMQRADF